MPRLKKATAHQRALKVAKGLRKHKGNASSLARELGITPQAVNKKKNNPEFVSLRQQAINKALERAGITESFVYNKLKKILNAKAQASYLGQVYESNHPDNPVQLKGIEVTLDLFQHTNTDQKDEMKPTEIHVHYGHRVRPKKVIEDGSDT